MRAVVRRSISMLLRANRCVVLFVGLCPDWQDWNPANNVNNATEAMDAAEQWLDVPQVCRQMPIL